MKRSRLFALLAFFLAVLAAGEALASARLLKVRKWSGPEHTRVVLDLEGPPVYEVQASPHSPLLTVYLARLVLPRGPQEILIEDEVIRKVRIDPAGKEGARVTFFLYRPAKWKVFDLKPSKDQPTDRLVIDVLRSPAGAIEEAGPPEKPADPGPQEAKPPPAKVEEPPRAPAPEEPRLKVPPPARVEERPPAAAPEEPPRKVSPPARVEEPPRAAAPEEPPKKVSPPARVEAPPPAAPPEEPREKTAAKGEEPARPPAPQEAGEKAAVPPRGTARLLDIRHWSAPDHTRVVVDLDGPAAHEVAPLTDPLVQVLHLRGVALPKGAQEISVSDAVIQKIRVEPAGKGEARVFFSLVKPGRLNVFLLKPYLDKPDRLVIDVCRPDLEEKEKEERQVSRQLKAKKKKIVVIDPGHGGEDPGAVGPRGTLEKDIVLAMARSLQKILDETGEVRAFLTRRGDYFLPLNDRVRIAREYGADLFISLHANGSRSRQTRGTSIYTLSLKGASDKATQMLAQKENASDLVGGISSMPVRKDLDTILLDLEQTHSLNESLQVAGLVLSEMGRVNQAQFPQPRQAGFAVLKAPDFPSVLVETAYITHPVEEMLLRQRSFQDRLCRAIGAAVKKYLPLLAAKEDIPSPDSGEGRPKRKGG